MKQFNTVYHVEYGKGYILSMTPKMKDYLCMCYFPQSDKTDWVLLSALETDTDEFISRTKVKPQPSKAKGDPLQQALENLFGR